MLKYPKYFVFVNRGGIKVYQKYKTPQTLRSLNHIKISEPSPKLPPLERAIDDVAASISEPA